MSVVLKVNNLQETFQLGYKLGQLLQMGDLVVLSGELGTGKTHFAQAIAKGLGIEEHVNSPTYTIINEYEGRLLLYHWDVYRLNSLDEMYDLGYEEYFYGSGVTLIEWGEKIAELLPDEYLQVNLSRVSGPDSDDCREVVFDSAGTRYLDLIKELAEECMF